MEFYLGFVIVGLLLVLFLPVQATAERKYFTDARLAVVRSNLEKYEWAREQRKKILETADRWAKHEDERLRTLVVPPQVPRAYQEHNDGCPIHGVRAHETGLYKWGIDFDQPFKITCPVGGEVYPSNDFQAFLDSGMKDRSLLTGEYADDGWGWHRPGDPDPANYWFVAYYAHWSMMRFLMEAIESLGNAVILAESEEHAARYAHKAGLLLWQVAVYYPEYEYEKQSRESKEHNPKYTGKMFNMIWETWPPHTFAVAYDAMRPFLERDRVLQEIAGKDGAGIDGMIRERVLRESAVRITDGSGRIRGNYGMHQSTLLTLAQVMDESEQSPTSEEMIRYVLANPVLQRDTDMGLRDALENLVYRDGMPHESIGYNRIWVTNLVDLADRMVDLGVNLFEHPRMKNLLAWPFNVFIAGQFTPSTGDTGDMFANGGAWEAEVCQKALPYVDDPRLAWVLHGGRPGVREGLFGGSPAQQDLFSRPAEDLLARLPAQEDLEIGLKSFHFAGYSMVNLQNCNAENRSAVSFFYGDHPAHMHRDQLNILLFAYGNALLTDIGYPEQTDSFNHRLYGFFTNTVAHNTVVVDAVKQGRGPGKLYGLVPEGFAQVVDASCEGTYADRVSLYRRVNMLVEAAPGQSYVFDAFYVRGGSQHDYALHGTQADFTCDALGPVREKGTLAGEDVPYEQFYDDPELKDKKLASVPYTGYKGSGYQFLYNVRKGKLEGSATGTWTLTEPMEGQPERPWKGIGLRAHLLGEGEELFGCDGPVQKYKYLPKSVKFLFRRRTGENLESRFVTVFEPFQGKPWIKETLAVKITPEDGNVSAVRVDLADGGRHYVFHSLTPDQSYTLDDAVHVSGQTACLVLDAVGKPVRAMLLNGTELAMGDFRLEGKGVRKSRIVSVDYRSGVVEIADPVLGEDLRAGQAVRVAPDGFGDCVTLERVIDTTHFSIGSEDLQTAGGPVLAVEGDRIVSSARNPHVRLGMTLLNSQGEPQGRVIEKMEDGWRVDRGELEPMRMEDFPQVEGDPGPRYSIVVAGPGDEVAIPNVARF
ncbi:MAG: heparinase II/III family protein [bacterium]|nr:heparinase II/III family protein [bacterium]